MAKAFRAYRIQMSILPFLVASSLFSSRLAKYVQLFVGRSEKSRYNKIELSSHQYWCSSTGGTWSSTQVGVTCKSALGLYFFSGLCSWKASIRIRTLRWTFTPLDCLGMIRGRARFGLENIQSVAATPKRNNSSTYPNHDTHLSSPFWCRNSIGITSRIHHDLERLSWS